MRNILLTISYDGTDFCGCRCGEPYGSPCHQAEKALLAGIQGRQLSCVSAHNAFSLYEGVRINSVYIWIMKRLNDLDYLKLNKFQAFWYNLKLFLCAIPGWFARLGRGILNFFKNCGLAVKNEVMVQEMSSSAPPRQESLINYISYSSLLSFPSFIS